jgi:hypothetical protein
MNTQPDNNSNDMARKLAERLADMENANAALKEEIERKNKALEGFIAENEALKTELGGKATNSKGSREKENGSASSLPPKNSERKERRIIQLVRR